MLTQKMLQIVSINFSALLVLFSMCYCVRNIQLCEENEFDYVSIRLTCDNGARQFPATKKSISVVECLDCNIPVLSTETIINDFVGKRFNLSNSHIKIIKEDVFNDFPRKMIEFKFENNEIEYIAPKIFNNFRELEEISFRNSKISKLDAGVFNGTRVRAFILAENQFSKMKHVLDGLQVTRLNLSSNLITELEPDTFADVKFIKGSFYPHAQHLDLSHNLIEKIHPGAFRCNDPEKSIHILELNNNVITRITNNTFFELVHLEVLYLSDNSISQLETNSFKGLFELKALNLRNNRIRQIPVSLFADLKSLDVLDISQNLIYSLQSNVFSGLITLTKLNISHNNLGALTASHIFPLGKLTDLDISDIKLHSLDLKSILEHNSRLRSLVLNNNLWECGELIKIYAEMNKKFNGFNYPTRYFNVPNLHGIACSRQKLKSYNQLSFHDFLKILEQDELSIDWLNSKSIMGEDDASNETNITHYLRSIHNMFIFVVIVTVILLIAFLIKLVIRWLRDNHYIKSSRFSFMYIQEQQNVQVCP